MLKLIGLTLGTFALLVAPVQAGALVGEAALTTVEEAAVVRGGSAVATGGSSLANDAAMFADDSVTLVTRAAPVAESAGWRTVAGGLARKVGTRFLGPVGMVVGAAELGKFLGEEGREAYDFYAEEWASWRAERRHGEVMAVIDELAAEGEPGQGFGIVIAPGANGQPVIESGIDSERATAPAAGPSSGAQLASIDDEIARRSHANNIKDAIELGNALYRREELMRKAREEFTPEILEKIEFWQQEIKRLQQEIAEERQQIERLKQEEGKGK